MDDDGTDGPYHFGCLIVDTFSGSEAASAGCEGGGAAGFAAALGDGSEALEALFEEAAFGEDFLGAPAFEVGDAFFVFGEGALVADGFGFKFELAAFEETGDEFGDELGWRGTTGENIVDFDKIADGMDFLENGGDDFVGDDAFGVDGAFGVDVDLFEEFFCGVEVG